MKRTYRSLALCAMALAGCASAQTGPASGVAELSLLVPNGDHQIPIAVTMPTGGADAPAVVMLHGTGSNKDEAGNGYLMLAPKMAAAGIAAVRVDFPGSGDSAASYEIYSNTMAISDAEAVAAYVAKLDGIDGKRIGIMGWSQGGTDALLAAGSSKTWKSVLTWAGALVIGDMADEAMRAEAAAQGYTWMKFEWREPLKLGKKWIDEADSMDVLSYAAKIKAPICSVHGTLDDTVPFADSEKVQAVARNAKSRLVPIEGADHTFCVFTGDLTKYEQLAKETVAWFVETL